MSAWDGLKVCYPMGVITPIVERGFWRHWHDANGTAVRLLPAPVPCGVVDQPRAQDSASNWEPVE